MSISNFFYSTIYRKKVLLSMLMFLLASECAFSQGELPVDMYTGTPFINVPIHTISSEGISDAINLRYTPGIKVRDVFNPVGTGWSLDAGGSISREVRGYPDDLKTTDHTGWLYSKNTEIGSFVSSSDMSTITCTDEVTDQQKMTSWNNHDTEPDVFSFKASGLSGKFVFDNTGQVALIPYQDIQITPTFTSATDKTILSFTIKTNAGEVYTFDMRQTVTRVANASAIPQFYSTFYLQYQSFNPGTYAASWLLTKAAASTGGALTYSYSAVTATSATVDTLQFYIKSYNVPGYTKRHYIDSKTTNTNQLIGISSNTGPIIQLSYNSNSTLGSVVVRDFRDGDHSTTTSKFVKQYDLTYTSSGGRNYLTTLQEISGAEKLPSYTFGYNGYLVDHSLSISAPPENSRAVDFWGYFNGKSSNANLFPTVYIYPNLPVKERYRIYPIPNYSGTVYTLSGSNRNVDPNFITLGALKTITYPWGGSTSLVFEPNMYFDPVANTSFYGGGLRLQSTTYQDALFSGSKMTKSFTYTDTNGASSGRIITPPSFAIPTWSYINPSNANMNFIYGDMLPAEQWDYFTVRSAMDLTGGVLTQGSPVGYKEVKVTRPGTGYAKYEYEMPGTWGDAASGNWSPAVMKFARYYCTNPSMLDLVYGYEYPYSSLSTIDNERGLVKFCREYNKDNILVRLTETTYQNISKASLPLSVYGLRFERFANSESGGAYVYTFSKYALLTDYFRTPLTETVTVYDEANSSRFSTNSKSYFFNGTGHKLVSSISETDASNTIRKVYIRYPQDFGIVPALPADAASVSIATLQSTFKTGTPIETYSTVQKSGDVEKLVSGTIVKFKNFTTGKALPEQVLTWKSLAPLAATAYVKSYIDPTLKTFKCDPAYEVGKTISSYDTLDAIKSWSGLDGITNTIISGSKVNAPVVAVTDAAPYQFAFSDFDVGTEVSFTITSATGTPPGGRTGKNGLSPSKKLSKSMELERPEYMISGWCNKFNAGMTVTLKVMNTGKTVTHLNQSFTIPAGDPNAGFQYFEFPVQLTGVPIQNELINEYEISFTPTGTVTPTPILDDIAFYPQRSTVSSMTYTFPFGVESATNNAQTLFKVYNNLGNLKYEMDTNKNIIRRNTYLPIITDEQ